MKILLIGFGNVGRRLCELLSAASAHYPRVACLAPRVIGIVTRTKGGLLAPEGLDLSRVLKVGGLDGAQSSPISALPDAGLRCARGALHAVHPGERGARRLPHPRRS